MKYEHLGILVDKENPHYIDEFSGKLLTDYYTKTNETIPESLARPATAFCYGDYGLAQRIYDYAYRGWFMYASPELSNAPSGKWVENEESDNGDYYWYTHKWIGEKASAMPISCFSMVAPDNIDGQKDAVRELSSLSVAGGGVGVHNQIRATTNKAPGPVPYMKVLDSVIGYYRQSKTRRGSTAYYMDVSHPDIMEHIRFRIPSQGDPARKSDNRVQFHNAVNVTDDFIEAVVGDTYWDLKCPHSGEVRETIRARDIWEEILETRALTGEPYIFKVDTANRALPEAQRLKGLRVNGSNLCSEITLPTNEERTFVCCLCSLNLEYYDEWKDTPIVEDLVRFLDNVLQFFIENADEKYLGKAIYSAKKERALGLGAMGWHYYLQRNNIPFEGGGIGSSAQMNNIIFKGIKEKAVEASKTLAKERGEPEDMVGTGMRNSALLAIAPTSNNSTILKTSPSIEPVYKNVFTQTTRSGSFLVKNKYLQLLLEKKGYSEEEMEVFWSLCLKNNGSVFGDWNTYLTDEEKNVFKGAFEIDQHWIVEQADQRARYICQAQSTNLFFPSGTDRAYMNSVHMKFLKSEYAKSLYYYRTEKEAKVDKVKEIQRKSLQDWSDEGCPSCEG